MVLEKCRFCLQWDDVTKLADPCDCYKKNDSLLCHAKCLQEYIEELKRSERDNISENADFCPYCKKKFRVKLHWRWTYQRIFSSESCTQYFNILALILTCSSFFYSAYILFRNGELDTNIKGSDYLSEHHLRENKRKVLIVEIGIVIILLSGLFVLRKLYLRWKRNQMNIEVIDVL